MAFEHIDRVVNTVTSGGFTRPDIDAADVYEGMIVVGRPENSSDNGHLWVAMKFDPGTGSVLYWWQVTGFSNTKVPV